MPKHEETKKLLETSKFKTLLAGLYGNDEKLVWQHHHRYLRLLHQYQHSFGDDDMQLFSAPGRIEIGGNHTDHNHGRVLAASINLDAIAAAAKTAEDTITLYSEGFPHPFIVDLKQLARDPREAGTTSALIRGIAARCHALDLQIGGFNAFIASDIAPGSGLSSSACIEVLLATMLNHFYNERVLQQVLALEIGDFGTFLHLVDESGNSSNKWLQNGYALKAPSEQGLNLALALTEEFLKKIGAGACRVHGGGFAGTIQVFLPEVALGEYVERMQGIFGTHAVSVLQIRSQGAMKIALL